MLAYGIERVSAPRYDLQLAAERLLSAKENVSALAPAEGGETAARALFTHTGRAGRVIFWGALTLMVLILLWAVAKLLPKA